MGRVDRIPIGQAARRLGLSTSALRYYDERGLVRAPARRSGRRMYGRDELRQLAFIKLGRRLGLPLHAAAEVLGAPGPQWRDALRWEIRELDEVIARALAARRLLTHAVNCPTDHPVRECDVMISALDRLADGESVERLMAEQASETR